MQAISKEGKELTYVFRSIDSGIDCVCVDVNQRDYQSRPVVDTSTIVVRGNDGAIAHSIGDL